MRLDGNGDFGSGSYPDALGSAQYFSVRPAADARDPFVPLEPIRATRERHPDQVRETG